MSFKIKEIKGLLKNLETLADQTVVHRKKFEFTMVQLRKFVQEYEQFKNVPMGSNEQINVLFQELISIINQNVLQTWTVPTIENSPDYVLDQLQSLFVRFRTVTEPLSICLAECFEPDSEEWIHYNILDLRAISASFNSYLKSSSVSEQIRPKIQAQIDCINSILSKSSPNDYAMRTFSPIPVHYQSWRVEYSDFEEIKEIGKGVSAHVFKGIQKSTGIQVAIKKFHFSKLNSSRFQSYQREVAVLATVQHPSLLKLIGATDSSPFCIITEWMNGGSLYHALKTPGYMSSTERTIAAYDIARGMQFLHSRKIVHRDMKSLNVLLDDNKKVRICDFGFSRFANENTLMTSNIGTPHWMAPELLIKGTQYSSKIDVYAFGIVLWELATCETPYNGCDSSYIVNSVIHNDMRPPLPTNLNPDMKNMITQCWDRKPDVRPSFEDIVKQFKISQLQFNGAKWEEVKVYIDQTATEGEIQINSVDSIIQSLENAAIPLSIAVNELKVFGIPHDLIDRAWDMIVSINTSTFSIEDFNQMSILVSMFISTSKLSEAALYLRNLPISSISSELMLQIIKEIPTGSSETDRNLVIAACKNNAADLCALYAHDHIDIALALEVISHKGADVQLKAAVIDRCVQSLSSTNNTLVLSAAKCILTLGESRRIPLSQIIKFIEMDDPQKKEIAYSACVSLLQAKVSLPERIIMNAIKDFSCSIMAPYVVIASCSELSTSSVVLQIIDSSTVSSHFLSTLIQASYFEENHIKIREIVSTINRDDVKHLEEQFNFLLKILYKQ